MIEVMKLISAVLILLFSGSLHAATFKIFAAETPPFLEKTGEGVAGLSGIYGKIVSERIMQAGKASDFEVIWVPWKRALSETIKAKNGLFFPLARIPEREKDYIWLAHLGSAESWFYSTNPKLKIRSNDDLKKYRIGFLNGSMRSIELKKILGEEATNLDGLTEDIGNLKKLLSGRIDIWTTQTEVFDKAVELYKAENKSTPKIYAIKKFLDQEIWLVSAASMEEKYQDQIRAIFKSKKKDPAPKQVSSAGLLSFYRQNELSSQ
jgi:polar amino acid transport system substrate-binding protein